MSLSPGNVDDVTADLARGLKLIQAKQPEYHRREEYYRGQRHEVITHPKLQQLLDRYGNSFNLNYAAVPCDALMDRVDLMSLTTNDKSTDALLRDRLWMPNSLDDDADDIHLHASYLGDYYLVAEYIADQQMQDDEDDDETGTGIGTIELTPKHPNSMVIVYQRSNSRIPDFAVQMIQGAGKGEWEALVYYDDETWEFEATEDEQGFDATKYTLDLDDDGEADPIPNEVGLFPVFHFRPDSKPYGQPVNLKMYGPQDAITKINATQMAAIDHYGFPVRVALLDPNAEVDDSIDDDFNDDDVRFNVDGMYQNAPVEGRSKASFEPGGVTMLPGIKSIAQFDAADPRGFLDPLTFHIRAGATLTRTPLYEFDLDGQAEMSGEARRRADGPITKHAGKIKGQFGTVWAAIGTYTLTALNVQTKRTVEAVWAPSETATDNEGISLVALKVENGIPLRQALLEAGYTQEQVDQFAPVDLLDGLETPVSANLLLKLTAALRDLGSAKQLGAVSDDQIRRLLHTWYGDVVGAEPLPAHELTRVTDAIGNSPTFGGR